jgi:hypothetical protein
MHTYITYMHAYIHTFTYMHSESNKSNSTQISASNMPKGKLVSLGHNYYSVYLFTRELLIKHTPLIYFGFDRFLE